jgi:hypothetical protein
MISSQPQHGIHDNSTIATFMVYLSDFLPCNVCRKGKGPAPIRG